MNKLFLLGVGTTAKAVRVALPEYAAAGTTRGAPDARFSDILPIAAHDLEAIRVGVEGARVVVSFPPDGRSDRALSGLVANAASVVYVSSSAVYAAEQAVVTETSPVTADSERARLRLEAEAAWRAVGASIVRLPAFYGPAAGLHLSLARASFRMPGSGANFVSRVHVDDAARFVLAALRAPAHSLLLAGDDQPAPVAEVVKFVSALFELPLPQMAEGEDIPLSLRANRRIDNSATKARYAIQLAYPTYREGYGAIRAAQLAAK